METRPPGIGQRLPPGKVRFHLGSGINGNNEFYTSTSKATPENEVRFHLGSGINGNDSPLYTRQPATLRT